MLLPVQVLGRRYVAYSGSEEARLKAAVCPALGSDERELLQYLNCLPLHRFFAMLRVEQELSMAMVFASVFGLSVWLMAASVQADCKPSKWGAGDELGAGNTITPARVLAASKLIKRGQVRHLGIVVDRTTPAYAPRSLSLTIVQPNQAWNAPLPKNGLVYNDDIFTGWFGIGSQIDGLAHIGHGDGHGAEFYNCFQGKDISQTTGMTKLGIDKIPPIAARGVLIDMATHLKVKHLDAGQAFGVAEVEAAAQQQRVSIKPGDVVLFHTGWTDAKLQSDPQAWGSAEPGLAPEVATWLASKGVLAVGADTWGVDVIPPLKEGEPFPGHMTLLKDHGIYILEVMDTGPLAREHIHEFFFVLGPSRIRGAVQAIVDPIAIY